MIIEESGMRFGDYNTENVYYIEKDEKYKCVMSNGVSTVEFVICDFKDGDALKFIEAKQSAPNPENENNKEKFPLFLKEISKKFLDSFEVFERVWMENGLSSGFSKINATNCKVIFILVINGHKKEWLMPIRDGLQQIMLERKTMNVLWRPEVFVINEKQAMDKGLLAER